MEAPTRDQLNNLTKQAQETQLLERYDTILNSMRQSAECGDFTLEITKPYPYEFYPLFIWLLSHNFILYAPNGPDSWRRCESPEDPALQDRYTKYLISWEDI